MENSLVRAKVAPLLSPREELIWIGQPWQGIRFYQEDWFMIPVSVSIGGIFIFMGVIAMTAPTVSVNLTGLIFVLPALYFIVGRFFMDAYLRSKTYYALTNRRVLIHFDGLGVTTTSFDLRSLANLRVETGSTTRGTVYLNDLPYGVSAPASRGIPFWGSGVKPPPALEMISDAQHLYEMIQDIRG